MQHAPISTTDATSNVSSNFPVKKNAVSQVISVTILIKYENSVIVIKFSYSWAFFRAFYANYIYSVNFTPKKPFLPDFCLSEILKCEKGDALQVWNRENF